MNGENPPQPGWWQASDGQWYPPQEQTPVPPPPPAPSAGGPPQPGWWQASDGQWYPPQQPTQQQPAISVPTPPPSAPGPGWWQASDGQWYPPQGGTPGSGGGRQGWIIGAIVGVIALVGLGAFIATRGDDDDVAADDQVQTDTDGDTDGDDGPVDDSADTTGGDIGLDDGDSDGLDSGPIDDGMSEDGFFDDGDDSTTTLPETPVDGIDVTGNEGEPHNEIAIAAAVDLEQWWGEIMPSVYGIDYTPIQGGFFAASPDEPLPPCATEPVVFNAYYCSNGDVIAWDDTELFPQFLDTSGPLAIGVIMAHEIGHAIQQRVDNMSGFTVTLEHQADCFAGAWVTHVSEIDHPVFAPDEQSLDLALAAFLQLGDAPGASATDPSAHGNAFDRINGFQDGLANGATSCAGYTDDNIVITELPFTSEDDFNSGGNLPLAESLDLFPADLEAFWSVAYPDLTGEPWVPLQGGLVTFDANTDSLTCGGAPVDFLLFYCIDDDYVGLDVPLVATTLHEDIGDLAVASLVASQYGLAVQARIGVSRDPYYNNLQADCLAGVWSASIFPGVAEQRDALIILSPGDFDEAVAALLTIGADPVTHGTGFERVTAFRAGVLEGIEGCVAYDPPGSGG